MKITTHGIFVPKDIKPDWHTRVMSLWVEDDSGAHDRERIFQAHKRIGGRSPNEKDGPKPVATHNGGHFLSVLYDDGLVHVAVDGLMELGVIVDVQLDETDRCAGAFCLTCGDGLLVHRFGPNYEFKHVNPSPVTHAMRPAWKVIT